MGMRWNQWDTLGVGYLVRFVSKAYVHLKCIIYVSHFGLRDVAL